MEFVSSSDFAAKYENKSSAQVVESADLAVSYDSTYTTDGMTVYLFGTDAATVDLSTGVYGSAVNIDASNSAGANYLMGNWASNVIISGPGPSYLWGGSDYANDFLIGGWSYDTFYYGMYEGNDAILNGSSIDIINLYDAYVSDIASTAYDGTNLALLFGTGNTLVVACTDMLSPIFTTADGGTYTFNRTTYSWQ